MVANVPANTPTVIQAKRRARRPSAGPASICQTLVAMAGSVISAAPCAGGMTMLSRPTTTVGRPTPTAPLKKPATRKARAMNGQLLGNDKAGQPLRVGEQGLAGAV